MRNSQGLKQKLNLVNDYILTMLRWVFFSFIVGIVCGLGGVLFHYAVDEATLLREHYPVILFFLPVAGIAIVFLYHIFGMDDDKGTNSIFLAVREETKIHPLLAPVILISTALTHLCGGSSGREGAALQIGGGIASLIARLFRLKTENKAIVIMCGMSAVFSAVFGTPITATVFTLEVVSVGLMHYSALLPALLSSVIAYFVAQLFGIAPTSFTVTVPQFDLETLFKVFIVAVLAGLLSIVFIVLMHSVSKLLSRYIPNRYIKIVLGGLTIIALTYFVGTSDYNGAGMSVIKNALENGEASPFAFLLKIIFTVITLSVGFKGGEIVPSFFIGSTFGVLVAPLFGIDPSFSAAIGLLAFFCGAVNCPVATIILSIELFGAEGLIYFALAVAVSYIVSGNHSLYSSQKIVYSKLHSLNKSTEQ